MATTCTAVVGRPRQCAAAGMTDQHAGEAAADGIPTPEVLGQDWQRLMWERTSTVQGVRMPESATGVDDWLPSPHGFTLAEALFDDEAGLRQQLAVRHSGAFCAGSS